MVLVEGTNLSEGRGTTRPFEIFGAPYLNANNLSDALNARDLPGVHFRPCTFEPTFQKHAGTVCGGAQLHVTDRDRFRPVATTLTVFEVVRRQAPDDFAWIPPPYEYETEKMPIDILYGHDGLRLGIDSGSAAEDILAGTDADVAAFTADVAPFLLYD
jgi:uncharacterized protein YbbC (DUF1343 family)